MHLLLLGNMYLNLDFSSEGEESFLIFLKNDNFSEDTMLNENNKKLINNLLLLKEEAKNFHELNFCEAKNIIIPKGKIESISKKILNAYQNYELQISRLRMVIQPEYNITRVVNTTSKTCYLAARGYWFVGYHKKKRIFTKSLGREDEFVNGSNDKSVNDKLVNDMARREMQEQCKNEYLKKYDLIG